MEGLIASFHRIPPALVFPFEAPWRGSDQSQDSQYLFKAIGSGRRLSSDAEMIDRSRMAAWACLEGFMNLEARRAGPTTRPAARYIAHHLARDHRKERAIKINALLH